MGYKCNFKLQKIQLASWKTSMLWDNILSAIFELEKYAYAKQDFCNKVLFQKYCQNYFLYPKLNITINIIYSL